MTMGNELFVITQQRLRKFVTFASQTAKRIKKGLVR